MASAQAQQERLQDAMNKMLSDLDVRFIRPQQKESYLKKAACCDSGSSQQEVQRCVEQCDEKLMLANQVLQQSIGGFQDRLQRSVMRCRDDAEEQLMGNPSERQQQRAQDQLEQCMLRALQDATGKIPTLHKDLAGKLKQLG